MHVLQTHISWVFVASTFVLKVKKPVNLGFLDFSSLEKRRHFCQRQKHCGAALDPLIDDLGDLLAEKCCAAGGWMADSMHFAAEFF